MSELHADPAPGWLAGHAPASERDPPEPVVVPVPVVVLVPLPPAPLPPAPDPPAPAEVDPAAPADVGPPVLSSPPQLAAISAAQRKIDPTIVL